MRSQSCSEDFGSIRSWINCPTIWGAKAFSPGLVAKAYRLFLAKDRMVSGREVGFSAGGRQNSSFLRITRPQMHDAGMN
jgi:hypothetical protein